MGGGLCCCAALLRCCCAVLCCVCMYDAPLCVVMGALGCGARACALLCAALLCALLLWGCQDGSWSNTRSGAALCPLGRCYSNTCSGISQAHKRLCKRP